MAKVAPFGTAVTASWSCVTLGALASPLRPRCRAHLGDDTRPGQVRRAEDELLGQARGGDRREDFHREADRGGEERRLHFGTAAARISASRAI